MYRQSGAFDGRVEVEGPLRGIGIQKYQDFTEEEFVKGWERLYGESTGQDAFDEFLEQGYIVEVGNTGSDFNTYAKWMGM